ncbi:MAG: tRNA uridine-5-carboxymethylaminomethyl(34) synthesis GTPase MnmE [Thermoflexaceae bacterium]|nr:tRNA uridine-5-carboxymethylaminomethyl(34) synthesis GTPase MnmE [Thermoflexaceae bacterium]
MNYSEDTIAAISTGNVTNSGIGIIRMSGDEAIIIADKIFHSKSGKKLSDVPSHTIHYGNIVDGNEVLDEVLVMLMKNPHTYTREDVVEINCHGGMVVMNRILETCFKYGARPAEPGEFTKRAFLNGRIDLSQAEAVIDLINSKNELAMKSSINQLGGFLSGKIKSYRETILNDVAYIEAALDDPEHISLDDFSKKLLLDIQVINSGLENLIKTSDNGRILKEGINTVILGKPNAGKSSLLNVLARYERAIVTDIPGTTRDIIEEQININGILLNLIDTAGIRNTSDKVEAIGVDKARECASGADLIIYVVDSSVLLDENDKDIMDIIKDKNVIIILNKSDLVPVVDENSFKKIIDAPVISISTKTMDGVDDLEETIKELFVKGKIQINDELIITNLRQKNSLKDALKSLKLVVNSIENSMPEDFYTIDLMNAYEELGKITGESVEEDLANEIFSKFCMGK